MARKRRQGRPKKGRADSRSASPEDKGLGERGGKEEEPGSGLREWGKSLLYAGVLFFLIRTFLLQPFVIISGSMEESLQVGDLLIANRAAVGGRIPGTSLRVPGYSEPRRGDILVFDPHHEVDMKLVKRLLGLPGDTLEMRAKHLFLNGTGISEPYVILADEQEALPDSSMAWQLEYLTSEVDKSTYEPTRDRWGPIVVPEGHYFMLGDNRDLSLDSRYWGPLETWRVEARASFIYFSYEKNAPRPFPWLTDIHWRRIGNRLR